MNKKHKYSIEITTDTKELIEGIINFLSLVSENIDRFVFLTDPDMDEELARATMKTIKEENRD